MLLLFLGIKIFCVKYFYLRYLHLNCSQYIINVHHKLAIYFKRDNKASLIFRSYWLLVHQMAYCYLNRKLLIVILYNPSTEPWFVYCLIRHRHLNYPRTNPLAACQVNGGALTQYIRAQSPFKLVLFGPGDKLHDHTYPKKYTHNMGII